MKYFDDQVNPIVEARLQDGYSLKRLGKRLDMSAQYISRAEHGTYSDLNKALVQYAADILGIPQPAVMHRYKEFQKETRRRTAQNLNPKPLSRGLSISPGHEIFASWRSTYWSSAVAFSNAFCVHPEVVNTYEEGIRAVLPDQVRRALAHVKLLDPNWSEEAASRHSSPFGPVTKLNTKLMNAVQQHSDPSIVIRIPGPRSPEGA